MSLETRDPRLFFSRCTNPTRDTPIPDNRLSVQHSVEADDVAGLARSLLLGWMKNSEASVTTLSDRVETVQGMANDVTAWHCGGGNQHSTGDEIVGRASWSVDQWNTPTMDLAVRNVARTKARRWAFLTMPKFGITYYPEWLSLAQIGDGVTCGLCTHNDMRLVFGGTTHTDPGPNFPHTKLRNYIHAELDALLGKTAPQPAPAPSGPPKFPLPAGYYYGPLSGPAQSVSGMFRTDTQVQKDGLKLAQMRLNHNGNNLTVTGQYDTPTAAALKRFQIARGLPADGLIRPDTWKALWT